MITYRPTISPNFERMEEHVISIFNDIPFNHLIYFWENDRDVKMYHSHILVQSEFNEIIPFMFRNINGCKSIINGIRETLVKTHKSYVNPNSGEIVNKIIDKKVNIEFSEFRGSKGKVYLEPIVNKVNSCFYVSKYSDRGGISGYF